MTYLGQLVGGMTMLVGLVMLALPLSIIGTNFIEEDQQMKETISEQNNLWKVEDPKSKVKSSSLLSSSPQRPKLSRVYASLTCR